MPSPGEDIMAWSTTAIDNGSADPLIQWAEGQTRASVNNSSRSELAAHAKNRDLTNGSIVTTGTANAQAFISGVGYTSVPTGLRVLLKIGTALTNTGSTTLNMDGIGDVTIKNEDRNLAGGELKAGGYVELRHDGTNWILLNSSTLINTSTIHIIEVPADPATTVDFATAIDGTFSEYLFTGLNVVPAVLGAELWMQISTDAGATWKSGATDYSWAQVIATESGVAAIGDSQDSKILIANNIHNAANVGCCFTARVFTPALATHNTMIETNASHTAASPVTVTRWMGTGRYNALTPVNGVRFLMSSGTIVDGSIKMVGIR